MFPSLAIGNDYSHRHGKTIDPNRLYGATLLEKSADHYLIVDSYNNRVIYSERLEKPISQWKVLAEKLHWPHSIATDGVYYLIDDTYADKVVVYKRVGRNYIHWGVYEDVGIRPHRTRYDDSTNAFYVLGSLSQTITKFINDSGQLRKLYTKRLNFLKGAYTRSFTIYDDAMYFVSGPGKITKASYRNDEYLVLESYLVPEDYRDMIDVFHNGNYWYITSIKRKVLRCKQLSDLNSNGCEDIYTVAGYKGVPYYFSEIEGDSFVAALGPDNFQRFLVGGQQVTPEYVIINK